MTNKDYDEMCDNMKGGPGSDPAEEAARAQGREVGEMNKSSRFHPDNQGRGPKTAFMKKSPMNKKLKPCQISAARMKFYVYTSAYANIWASKHKC